MLIIKSTYKEKDALSNSDYFNLTDSNKLVILLFELLYSRHIMKKLRVLYVYQIELKFTLFDFQKRNCDKLRRNRGNKKLNIAVV